MITANFTAYGTYTTDSLYQWDKDQTLTVSGIDIEVAPEVHFTNADLNRALVRNATLSDGVITCSIPNSALQSEYDVKAYIGIWEDSNTFTTLETVVIPIIARDKPEDYTLDVGEDEEYYSFDRLSNQLANAATQYQLNSLIAHNQDTSSNTELIDIRNGADGGVYTTAGDAVRRQIGGLNSDLIKGSREYSPALNGTFSEGGTFVKSSTILSTCLIQFAAGATITIDSGSLYYGVIMWRGEVATANRTRMDPQGRQGTETITPDYDGYITVSLSTANTSSSDITVDDFDGSIVVTNGMINNIKADIDELQTATAKHVYEINLFYENTEDELDRITACAFLGFKVLEDGTDITSDISNFKSFIEEKLEQNTSYNLHNVIKIYSVENSSSTVTNSNHRELIVAYNNRTSTLTRFYCLNTDVKGFVFFKSGEITASFEPSDDVVLDQLTEKYYGTLVDITLDLTDLDPDLTDIDLVDANHFEDYLTITYTEYKLNPSTTEYASAVTYDATRYGLTRFINNRLPQMITKGKVDVIVEIKKSTGDDTWESITCRGEHITNANGDGVYSNMLKLTPILISSRVSTYLASENKYAGVILVPNYEHMASYNTELRYKSLVDDELTEGSTNLVTSGTLFDIVGDTELPSIGDGTIKDTINSLYNLLGISSKTASGEVVTVSDAAAIPPLSLTAEINAVQDLHGYDKPWAGGAGKNKFNLTASSTTQNGVTYTPNSDGSVSLSGGTSSDASFHVLGQITLEAGSYALTGGYNNDIYINIQIPVYYSYGKEIGDTFTIESQTTFNVIGRVRANTSVPSGAKFYPMIRLSSISDASFAPYSNICPITGWDSIDVYQRGKNLFSYTGLQEGYWTNSGFNGSGDEVTLPTTYGIWVYKKIKVNEGDVITSSNLQKQGGVYSAIIGDDETDVIATFLSTNNNRTQTIPSGGKYICYCMFASPSINPAELYPNAQVEVGTTATPYEAYNGQTYTTALSTTCYGGSKDIKGNERFTHGHIASYNGETLPSTWISDRDEYAEGTTPTIGAEVVYELATPTTATSDAIDLTLAEGVNNLWANSGDVELEYMPTVQSLIDALNS